MRWLLLVTLAAGCSGVVGADAKTSGPSNPGGAPGQGGQPGASAPTPVSNPPPITPAPAPPPAGVPGTAACGRLIPTSALSFENLPAAPGARLRVRVELTAGLTPPPSWSWEVFFGDGVSTEVPTTAIDGQSSEVELAIEKGGRYTLRASAVVGGSSCQLVAIAYALPTDRQLAQFRLRLAPPPGQPFPVQESAVQAQAGMPPAQMLVLQLGAEVVLEPHDATGGGGVSSYVRVTESRTALSVEGHTASGPFRALLLAPFTYDVLFVPDGDVAPLLQTGKTPAALNVLPLQLTPGTALDGQALDGAGRPVRDARVVLRAGALTSTVGASDAAGAFTLRARPGSFGVEVAPPPETGLPDLELGADLGISIPDGPSAGHADVRWAATPAAALSLLVRGTDGVRPAAGATVRLDREAPLAAAGTLTLQPASGSMLIRSLAGRAHALGVVGAGGDVSWPSLPTGRYRATATPPDGDATAALTTFTVEVGGAAPPALRLVAPVRIRGALLPGAAAAGALVHASPRSADPPRPVATAKADAGGAYELAVDPGRDYVLWAEPPPGRGLARTQLALVSAAAAGAQVPTRTLPRALPFTSVVTGETKGPQAGVVLQAFCDAVSPSCLDPTLPLAETVSGAGGAFTLLLPDPGTL